MKGNTVKLKGAEETGEGVTDIITLTITITITSRLQVLFGPKGEEVTAELRKLHNEELNP